MTTLYIVLKEWKLLLIAFLSLLLVCSGLNVVKQEGQYKALEHKHAMYVQQVKAAETEAQLKQTQKDLAVSEQFRQIEVKHNEQVQKLTADISNASLATNRLSKQLTSAEDRIKQGNADEVRAYSLVLSKSFSDCTGRYADVAGQLDKTEANAASTVEKYNSLIDMLQQQ